MINRLSKADWHKRFCSLHRYRFMFTELRLDRLLVVPLWLGSSSKTRKKPTRKMADRDLGCEKHTKLRTCFLPPRISLGHFFLAGFFRVLLDGLSESGITRSLEISVFSYLTGPQFRYRVIIETVSHCLKSL